MALTGPLGTLSFALAAGEDTVGGKDGECEGSPLRGVWLGGMGLVAAKDGGMAVTLVIFGAEKSTLGSLGKKVVLDMMIGMYSMRALIQKIMMMHFWNDDIQRQSAACALLNCSSRYAHLLYIPSDPPSGRVVPERNGTRWFGGGA